MAFDTKADCQGKGMDAAAGIDSGFPDSVDTGPSPSEGGGRREIQEEDGHGPIDR